MWLELGERKHPKEERIPTLSSSGGFILISNYIYGKQNNFYYLNLGFGQQKLIAVSYTHLDVYKRQPVSRVVRELTTLDGLVD